MNKRTIRGIRYDLGFTQCQMAKKLGIPISSYQRYERNEAVIPATILIQIADMVGIADVREIKVD